MELKWLEDFLSLAETRSFSRAAELRHVTQPALSRRIRALETWLGTDLIDRSVFPTRLTPAGEAFHSHAQAIVSKARSARTQLRGLRPLGSDTLSIALPHSLALAYFPKWLAQLKLRQGEFGTRVLALNVHDAVIALTEGHCDLLLCYHHARHPIELDRARYAGLRLGTERLRPYARCGRDRQPLWRLPGDSRAPVPFLGYAENAYLRRMVELLIESAPEPSALTQTFETDMAEALKVMVLEGHGVAFLPDSAVERELRGGRLALAGDAQWSLQMEIRLYRDRQHPGPLLDRLWDNLAAQLPAV